METTKSTPDYILDEDGERLFLFCNHCQKVIKDFSSRDAAEYYRKLHQAYYKHIPFKIRKPLFTRLRGILHARSRMGR